MNKYNIGLFFFKHLADALKNINSNIKKSLLILHDGEVIIRFYIKCAKNGIKHLTVLTGNANNSFYLFTALKLIDKRTHFYSLRTSAEDKHYFFHDYLQKFDIFILPLRQHFVNRAANYRCGGSYKKCTDKRCNSHRTA